MTVSRKDVLFWACLTAIVTASRLCHINILWADEDYHLASAIQVLHGKMPYRDFWYDKPPLNLPFYLMFGAHTGVALRLADSAFVLLCCALAFTWQRYVAAAALAFFLTFYMPSGVLPLEPDTLMIAPHLAAVYLACRGRPIWAGIMAGIAFQLNVRGVFILLFAASFCPGGILPLFAGFLIPNVVVLGWLITAGALWDYVEQVWQWGWLYARQASAAGLGGLFGWFGFHSALLVAAIWYWTKEGSKTLLWFGLALIFTLAELRFAPRYFNLLLPALVISAARGFGKMGSYRWAAIMLLAIPAIRFGPRYLELARDDLAHAPHTWRDVAMDQESREAAGKVMAEARPDDTIFIWGYRPDIVAYSRLSVSGRIWDSQPLTGVPADRHLSSDTPVDPDWAKQNRLDVVKTNPTVLVDGLSRYNPRLDIHRYPELSSWLERYCEAGRAGLTVIYRRCSADAQKGHGSFGSQGLPAAPVEIHSRQR